MRKKLAAAVCAAAVAALTLSLTSCAQGSATRTSTDGKSPITMWRAFASEQDKAYFMKHFVEPYNAQHPDTPVQITARDSDSLERLQRTAIASGSGPDIVWTSGPGYTIDYVENNQLLDLDKYAEKYGWADKLQSWAYEPGKVGGKLYSLPSTEETMYMIYNPQTFKDNGWSVPKTRADLDKIMAEAKAKGMIPMAFGAADWSPASEWLVTAMLDHLAGPQAVYDALNGKKKWTDPEFKDAISTLKDWFDKGYISGDSGRYFTTKEPEMYNQLVDGKAAFMFTGSWAFATAPKYFGKAAGNDATWAWAPIPSLSDRAPQAVYDMGIGESISINAATKHPDAVADYINWLISNPKSQLEATATTGVAPMPLKYKDSDYPANMSAPVKKLYQSLSSTKDVGYTTWTFFPPKTDVEIYDGMNKVITGDVSVDQYLQTWQDTFAQEFADKKVPTAPKPEGSSS